MLLKAPGGSKHVANLQGIWGCYQDARRNTEAMAFRGHRLLDQVRLLSAAAQHHPSHIHRSPATLLGCLHAECNLFCQQQATLPLVLP